MRKLTAFFLTIFIFLLTTNAVVLAQTTDVLIKNATVLTATKGTLENTDILIQKGKIAKIGKGLTASANAKVIDGTGKFVTPGIIDCHSHTMLDAINEGTLAVTSMTDVRDVLNPTDIAIYRALAGGVTSANLLHGSANSIGGQSQTVKFKFGKPVEDFPISDAMPGIKFAMGENPKRQSPNGPRVYPQTRMGVIETMRDALTRARDYKQTWDEYKAGKTKVPPRRNLELEPLVEVLEGKRIVHCHGYRSDEHLNLLRLAEEFGFRIGTLQHGLEAYKIAPEIAKHGAGVSVFTDSWSYKLEAYDAIPYDAYILWKNGVVVSINSDDDARMRRLNLDAAKVMKYGGVPEQDALQMITINPAKQLRIDKRTGSIEVGKDADLVIWSAHPFSVYSRVEMTMIEGEAYFDITKDHEMRAAMEKERQLLEKAEPNRSGGNQPPPIPREKRQSHHDESDGGNN